MIRITDKSFHYTSSFNTDLAKKFRKLTRDLRAAADATALAKKTAVSGSVVPMARRGSSGS